MILTNFIESVTVTLYGYSVN